MNNIDVMKLLAQITLYFPLGVLIAVIFFAKPIERNFPDRSERIFRSITFLTSLLLLAISIGMLFVDKRDADFDFLWVNFHVDALSIFMILLINIVAFAASWNSFAYLDETSSSTEGPWWQQKTGFHILINLFHLTMLLVPLSNNLVVVWIAIELTTVGSAILIVYERKKSAWEATWKYLIITSTGIVAALLGTIFLASNEMTDIALKNSNQLLDWTFLVKNSNKLDPQLVWFAFLFALVGYGTKAGIAFLNTWLPDGHGEAPAPISALLSGVLLKASFYVILRFYILTNSVLGTAWTSYTLLIVGLLSLLMATPFILKENPFKRVLAYHSLEHMGIIAFGFGIGGPIASAGALLHMLNHAVTKALMFLAHGNIVRKYGEKGVPASDISGALRTMPWSGGLLTLGGLALVGTPPFNIFMSEIIILWGTLSRFFPDQSPEQPNYPTGVVVIATTIFIISTTLIFYGLVNHMKKLVLGEVKEEITQERFSWSRVVPLIILFIPMLVLGLWIFPRIASLVYESVTIILKGTIS